MEKEPLIKNVFGFSRWSGDELSKTFIESVKQKYSFVQKFKLERELKIIYSRFLAREGFEAQTPKQVKKEFQEIINTIDKLEKQISTLDLNMERYIQTCINADFKLAIEGYEDDFKDAKPVYFHDLTNETLPNLGLMKSCIAKSVPKDTSAHLGRKKQVAKNELIKDLLGIYRIGTSKSIPKTTPTDSSTLPSEPIRFCLEILAEYKLNRLGITQLSIVRVIKDFF